MGAFLCFMIACKNLFYIYCKLFLIAPTQQTSNVAEEVHEPEKQKADIQTTQTLTGNYTHANI